MTSAPVVDSPAGATVDRLVAIAVLGCAVAVVVALASVVPEAKGHGTHVQLGLPPCGFAQQHHAPCPACGVTTAAAWVVRLAPFKALAVQPFGALLAAVGLALAGYAAVCLATKRAFLVFLLCLPWPKILLLTVAAALAGWGYTALTFES